MEHLIHRINLLSKRKVKFLVVSGSQYRAIKQTGIEKLLPDTIEFVQGPGCVLCSANQNYYDQLMALAQTENVIIAAHSDFLSVPGLHSTLEEERRRGADVRTCFTMMDILLVAKHNRRRKIVFPALGFETVAANVAATILQAKVAGLFNFTVFNGLKRLLPIVDQWIQQNGSVDAVLFTPQDIAVMGTQALVDMNQTMRMPIVVGGLDRVELLQSILLMVQQVEGNKRQVEVQPDLLITKEGIVKSQQLINEVFTIEEAFFPGIGIIPSAGFSVGKQYALHNTRTRLHGSAVGSEKESLCLCDQMISGEKRPQSCIFYKKECNPIHPKGACMASKEGPCHLSFLY